MSEKNRQAYLTLLEAIQEKPIDKTKTHKEQLIQINDSAHYIRGLQNIAVYLDIIK